MHWKENGFSLIEVVVVSAVSLISIGLAAPSITEAVARYQFNTDVQQLATTIRNARYKAVAANTTMRLLLNCPTTGQMRLVQVATTNPAVNTAADRCDPVAYPFPGVTPDTRNDGPVLSMGTSMRFPGTVASIEISTTGRMVPLAGCPTCAVGAPPFVVAVEDDRHNLRRNISVAASGQISVAASAVARTDYGN